MERKCEISDEFAARMIRENEHDMEQRHIDADNLLCALLESLGYTQTVKAFREMDKWYA